MISRLKMPKIKKGQNMTLLHAQSELRHHLIYSSHARDTTITLNSSNRPDDLETQFFPGLIKNKVYLSVSP